MRTLVCDLDAATRESLGLDARFDATIGREELEAAGPCGGCLGCWAKTPGRCVLRDPLGDLGPLLGSTDELAVISSGSFGGYGSLVKRALDRSTPYLHPRLRVVDGETRRSMRYEGPLATRVWLYGPSTPDARSRFLRLVRANERSLGARVRGVWFPPSPQDVDPERDRANEWRDEAGEAPDVSPTSVARRPPRRVALLCASPRGRTSTSHALLDDLADALAAYARVGDTTCPDVLRLTCTPSGGLAGGDLEGADALVVAYPLYVDGPPSGLVALLERIAREGSLPPGIAVYAVGNLGLYESCQLMPSLSQLRAFCGESGASWEGGVAVGGGGMVLATMGGPRMGSLRRRVSEAVDQLAIALLCGTPLGVVEARCPLPRRAYMLAADREWRRAAREAGADLGRAYRR